MSVRKILFWSGGVASLVFVFLFGTLAYVHSYKTHIPQYTNVDCAVVFGAAVYPGGVASGALFERTRTAVDLFQEGIVSCIVLSGAESAYNAHEVDVMRDIALAEGVPLSALEFDHEGENTLHTLEHLSLERSYALVSNDFHLARIDLLARRVGLTEYVLVPSVYTNGRYTREWLFAFREAVALWYYGFSFAF